MEDPRIISALFIFLKMAYYNVLINSGSDTGEKAGNCCKSPGKDYNISRELSCYLKRQSIYQNNLYNTNDTANLWLYGPQWKTKKIGFWMCTVPDGARRTRVEGIVQLIPIMKSLDK